MLSILFLQWKRYGWCQQKLHSSAWLQTVQLWVCPKGIPAKLNWQMSARQNSSTEILVFCHQEGAQEGHILTCVISAEYPPVGVRKYKS